MASSSKHTIAEPSDTFAWTKPHRIVVSFLLVAYLFIVIAAPATHPVSQSELTRPVAKILRPIHQTMYLGHGYRFFAPNPGPSHILKYTIETAEGSEIEGQFPDRDLHWPRLLYHRWFMLCESLYSDSQSFPDPELFEQGQREIEKEIANLRQAGRRDLAQQLEDDTAVEVAAQKVTQKRIEDLTNAIGQYLLRQHDGQHVRLSLHERGIPLPQQITLGAELDDPRQMSPALKTWEIGLAGPTEKRDEDALHEVPQP